MCTHGDEVKLLVVMPAELSYTGRARYKVVGVDRCIAPQVGRLNASGRLTANACCGHGLGPGSIFLHDGTEIEARCAG